MVDMFWMGLSMGVHVGHSETLKQPRISDDEQVMWWSKGGHLHGLSPARIWWFREHILEVCRRENVSFSRLRRWHRCPSAGCECSSMVSAGFMLVHVRSSQPCTLQLPGASLEPATPWRVDA